MGTKKRLILVKNQYAGCGTNRTSKIIKWGVAKLHDEVQYINTWEYRNVIYWYINVPTYPNLYYREEIDI